MNARHLLCGAAIACITCIAARATTIQFQAGVVPTAGYSHVGDGARSGESPQPDRGSDTEVLVGQFAGSATLGTFRSYLSFDLDTAAGLPAGATVQSATLTMTTVGGGGAGGAGRAGALGTVRLAELEPGGDAATLIVEGQTNWNEYAAGNAWNTGGGDIGTELSSTTLNGPQYATAGVATTFPTSTAFVARAQAAFDEGRVLQMLLYAPDIEAVGITGNSADNAYTRWGTDDYATAARRPLLELTYTTYIPEPNSILLLLAAMYSACRRATR